MEESSVENANMEENSVEYANNVSYSSCAEGFGFNGWRYFCLGVDSYEQFYY